ncbi:MAG: apolipoprotein N-acyltransferase [Ilumatobacteraceae bacterium]
MSLPLPLHRLIPSRRALTSALGGLLVAASLPPWGFWPLAFVGIAVYETAAQKASNGRERLAGGWWFAAAWLFPGMVWMWFLTVPGYLVATAMFALFHGVAAWAAPRGSWRVIGRPAAHTLAEALRFCFPFGGVPLASLPIGQAAGPFASVGRVGGAVLLTWFVFQVGFALSGPSPVVPAMARKRGVTSKGEWHGVAGLATALLMWLVVAPLADAGDKSSGDMRVAIVQGGGEQGTHAIDTSAADVLARHLEATAEIEPGTVDLVVWPENVIDVVEFDGSNELALVVAEAERIGAPFAVGITEDSADGDHFLNAQVIVTPDGEIVSRYDKVRRVPFGEYMPWRGFLQALGAPTNLVPRDAIAGEGPAVLELPDGTKLSTVISWEVFFGGRVNEGVEAGGEFIINPTNGSSYTWTVLQSQQVAASRLRAIEQHRWVVQASPTGFSAFISPDGDVYQRTGVSEQSVIIRTIALHDGRTWYSHTGNIPWVALMALLLVVSLWRSGAFNRPERESASAELPR